MPELTGLVATVLALILTVSFHEAAHGWAAERFGDPTARELGRITLNPLKHIDPMFSVVVPLLLYLSTGFAFGGAKPVPFDPHRFRPGTRIKQAIGWVAAAGPISNFLLAILAQFLIQLCDRTLPIGMTGSFPYLFLTQFFICNIVLGVFNLLPIPPLDGSKVLAGFLPDALAFQVYRLERYAFAFIILIMALQVMGMGRYLFTPILWAADSCVVMVRALFPH